MGNKTKMLLLLSLGLAWSLFSMTASAQDESLKLGLNRDFGYSWRGDIQGTFTATATGPADLQRVTFSIDGQPIGEDTAPPFELRFTTDSYSLGMHMLQAVGTTAAGQELRSNQINANFVSADEGTKAGLSMVLPMMAILLAAVAITAGLSMIGSGKLKQLPPGTPRTYGAAGGAICGRCGRPFPRHFFAPNMVLGKLERCPFCGKWAIVAGQSMERLRAAEAAELEDAASGETVAVESEEERLRKQIEDSRYG